MQPPGFGLLVLLLEDYLLFTKKSNTEPPPHFRDGAPRGIRVDVVVVTGRCCTVPWTVPLTVPRCVVVVRGVVRSSSALEAVGYLSRASARAFPHVVLPTLSLLRGGVLAGRACVLPPVG